MVSCDREQILKTSSSNKKTIGVWSFSNVDSCFQFVTQNPETFRTTISQKTGEITFIDDGTGSLTSNLFLYCNYGSFTWQYKSDTLTIYARDSYSNLLSSEINFIAEDTMLIKLQSCIPKRGIRLWYEVLASKNVTK